MYISAGLYKQCCRSWQLFCIG